MNVVHVTHEAVEHIGGIGTVIAGLSTAEAYCRRVERTVLVGPVFSGQPSQAEILRREGAVLYETFGDRPEPWRGLLEPIEQEYGAGFIIGRRTLREPITGHSVQADVLLVDVFHLKPEPLNAFKAGLWEMFDVPSDQFEADWEYEQYIRLACPAVAAMESLDICGEGQDAVILAHEYMGVPTALKVELEKRAGRLQRTKTVFHAHEVASVRPLVEKHPGHDVMFYNVMRQAMKKGLRLEEVFPAISSNFKHPLVHAARNCDCVFAVGDEVAEELEFLDERFEPQCVYNGIPAQKIDMKEKQRCQKMLREYFAALLGYEPDWIFTHVARPVISKGIWRDLAILDAAEPMLARRGERAVFVMLGTLGGRRRETDVLEMERLYDWPRRHENGYPDLCNGEEPVGETFRIFNDTHHAAQAVFVNQWGFDRAGCGRRMNPEMNLGVLRRGADVEFGLSIYEPFGISQLEPLCFGAICVVSSVCGCVGFAREILKEKIKTSENLIAADYTESAADWSLDRLLAMTIPQRDRMEHPLAERLAKRLIDLLPRNEESIQHHMEQGFALAREMSWEKVASEHFFPGLNGVETI